MHKHPCLCDICLKARDDELRRARLAEQDRVVTMIGGCIVHGDVPMSEESKAAVREIIAAARTKLSN